MCPVQSEHIFSFCCAEKFSQLKTKWCARPKKTQVSMGIPPEFSLFALWEAKDLRSLHADYEDFDQTGWMHRLICFSLGAHIILLLLFFFRVVWFIVATSFIECITVH